MGGGWPEGGQVPSPPNLPKEAGYKGKEMTFMADVSSEVPGQVRNGALLTNLYPPSTPSTKQVMDPLPML